MGLCRGWMGYAGVPKAGLEDSNWSFDPGPEVWAGGGGGGGSLGVDTGSAIVVVVAEGGRV